MIYINAVTKVSTAKNSRMTADSLTELQILAKKYGITQARFYGRREGIPHYDIPIRKNADVLAAKGVKFVDAKVFLTKCKALGKTLEAKE